MFSRLTILLFVFFAVAGLMHVAAPRSSRVAQEARSETASAPSQAGLTIDRIITGHAGHQP